MEHPGSARLGRVRSAVTLLILLLAASVPAGCGENSPALPDETTMKVIGVIGGMSWESSTTYYAVMNTEVREKLGGLHSAKILMYSIEFGDFSRQERLAQEGNWEPLRATMVDAAKRLERGGADFIVIASNTLNSAVGVIEENVSIPVLNIIDVTGGKVREAGIGKVALLGTKYTMEQGFYKNRLRDRYGLEVVTPDADERDYINNVIFDELCAGTIKPESRARFVEIIERLVREEGAEGVILGCTEIPLLVGQEDVSVPAFDTTRLHAEAAVEFALK